MNRAPQRLQEHGKVVQEEELLHSGHVERHGEQMSLSELTAHQPQLAELQIGLYPLRDDLLIQGPGQADDGRDDPPGRFPRAELSNELAIDLEDVHRQAVECGQG